MLKNKSTKNKTSKESLKKPEVFIMTQSNTKELEGARTATTGEEFTTLDERIDCEVERLNKKIEVSMLQQEDKESHVVENTVKGMTTDMVIEGRTLQNLWKPISIQWEPTNKWFNALASSINFSITGKVITVKNTTDKAINFQFSKLDNNYDSQVVISPLEIKVINVTSLQKFRGVIGLESVGWENTTENKNKLINGLIVCIGEHSYLPNTYFEGLKSFGEAEQEGDKYKISILSYGKNIGKLDLSNKNIIPFEDGYRLDCVALYRGDEDIFDLKGKYKPNTPYVLSYYGKILDNSNANNYRIRVYYTDNTYTDGVVTGNKYEKRIIKTLSGKTVYKITGYYGAMNGDFIIKDLMLEEGTEATQYEEYREDKKDILLSELGFDEGLKGFDLISCDKLNSKLKKVIKMIEKYIFTGNENFSLIASDSEGDYISFLYTGLNNRKYQTKLISNNFVKLSSSQENKEGIYCYSSNFNISIRVLKNKLNTQDAEGFKAWLKANPTTVYYELAEPVETPLTKDINLKTFGEKTYIGFENSISGTSSFKVPVDTTATITRLNRENRALEEENVKLKENMIKQTIYFENEDKKMTDYSLDMDFKMCLMEMDIEDIKANLGGDINAKK